MSTIALPGTSWRDAPKLRLVPKRSERVLPVLIAGRDAQARARVLDELAATMPSTRFQEVGTFWEALVRAPHVRMIVLSGELDGIPAESLSHMIGNRYPGLPVISLDALGSRVERAAARS